MWTVIIYLKNCVNNWYDLLLGGMYQTHQLDEINPTQHDAYKLVFVSWWVGLGWNFILNLKSSQVWVDN